MYCELKEENGWIGDGEVRTVRLRCSYSSIFSNEMPTIYLFLSFSLSLSLSLSHPLSLLLLLSLSLSYPISSGRPWMKGMLENHPLFLSVFVCVGGVIVASWEMAPQLNDMIQLAPFPNDTYRYKVVILVVSTIFGTFMWDRFCTMMFAPRVFKAMTIEASKTTLKDVQPVGPNKSNFFS